MNIKSLTCVLTFAISILLSAMSYADPVWIDVRSLAENQADNIEGDMRITHTDIVTVISNLYPDHNTDIRLYCRSGNRAGKALAALNNIGYSNVENIGSIADDRKIRSETKTK